MEQRYTPTGVSLHSTRHIHSAWSTLILYVMSLHVRMRELLVELQLCARKLGLCKRDISRPLQIRSWGVRV